MNSVMEIGDNILFIHQGKKWWEGDRKSILTSDNPEINAFVFASEFMKEIRSTLKGQKR
jgi:phospholipid/cholesterol/gamma-HCH transport system ATP-binding protein